MAERAAHLHPTAQQPRGGDPGLVDHVFPDVPVRQWVLSLPYRLRYRLAWDHGLCRAVVAVSMRAVLGWLRGRARLDDVANGRGGAVAIVQRFGGALNLNVHVHALVLDGVFARGGDGRLGFHPLRGLTAADVADVLAAIAPRVRRLLARRGAGEDSDGADPFVEATPVLAGLSAASVQGGVGLDRASGARPRRLGVPPEDVIEPAHGACHARWHGFDLHAGLLVPAGERERLERVCRYALRPPVTDERLRVGADGQVVLRLRHPWTDGTTDLTFAPPAFLERLAVLVPRPRVNLVLYHGVLAPRAAWRAEVVPRPAAIVATDASGSASPVPPSEPSAPRQEAGRRWAELMRRAFGFDVLACPRCGGRLRLIALLDESAVTRRILQHLGLPTGVPSARPARAPPLHDDAA